MSFSEPRYKKCIECGGFGYDMSGYKECEFCDGEGKIWDEQIPEENNSESPLENNNNEHS